MLKTCLKCGVEFKTKNRTRKYCSKNCYCQSRIGIPTWNKDKRKMDTPALRRLGDNSSRTRKERYSAGILTVWNKGLTKDTDPRVKKISDHHADLNGDRNPFYGRKHTIETKGKIAIDRVGKTYDEIFGRERANEILQKISSKVRGELNPMFNNWISREPYSKEWTSELKKMIMVRDGNRCRNEQCRGNSHRIVVHHIDYNKKNCSPQNLITLCNGCNSRANKNREEWTAYYRAMLDGGLDAQTC